MSKEAPPSYEQSQGMENPHYMGPNPTYPNTGQIGFQPPVNPDYKVPPASCPNTGHPYPNAGQPYPNTGQPYPNAGQAYPNAGQPYPGAGEPYPNAGQPYPQAGQPYYSPGPHQYQTHPVAIEGHMVHVPNLQGAPVPILLTTVNQLGPRPATVYCPTCKDNVTTKIKMEAGTLTWISCAALAFFGLWLGCCLIPFCVDCCQDVYHSCPRCKTSFGRYSRIN